MTLAKDIKNKMDKKNVSHYSDYDIIVTHHCSIVTLYVIKFKL